MHAATRWHHTDIVIWAATVPVRNATLERPARWRAAAQRFWCPCRLPQTLQTRFSAPALLLSLPRRARARALVLLETAGAWRPAGSTIHPSALLTAAGARHQAAGRPGAARPAGRKLNSSARCRVWAATSRVIMGQAAVADRRAERSCRPPATFKLAPAAAGGCPPRCRPPGRSNLPTHSPPADAGHGAVAAAGHARAAAATGRDTAAAAAGRSRPAAAPAAGGGSARHDQAHAAAGAWGWGQRATCIVPASAVASLTKHVHVCMAG